MKLELGRLTYILAEQALRDERGDLVHLRAQSEKTLHLLVENIGKLVTRDALIEAVWPDLNVTDDSLTQCIADIRRAIGDSDRDILVTVPKRGFILKSRGPIQHEEGPQIGGFAEVAKLLDTPNAGVVHLQAERGRDGVSVPTAARVVDQGDSHVTLFVDNLPQSLRDLIRTSEKMSLRIGIDVAGQSAATAKDMSILAQPGQAIVSADVKEASAIAPDIDFEDLGDVTLNSTGQVKRLFQVETLDPQTAIRPRQSQHDLLPTIAVISPQPVTEETLRGALGDLIGDEISSALSLTQEARIISRLSCRPYRLTELSHREIAARLGAKFVIFGRYRRAGQQIILDVDLGQSQSDDLIQSERYTFTEEEIFSGPGIIHDIVSRIRKSIILNEIEKVRSHPIEDLDSYTMSWAAVGLMHRLSPSDFNWAKRLLDVLIERSPYHPSPLAWMARWHVLKAQQGWTDNAKEDAARALDCASRALDIDPENGLALVNRGIVLTNLMARFDDAEQDYNAVLMRNPNDAHGKLLRGMLFAFQDRGAEAVRDTEQALRLAPLDPHRFFYLALTAGANLAAGDYARALELTKASLRLNRTHTSTLRMLVVAHQLSGDDAAARQALEHLLQMQPGLTIGAWLKSSPSASFEIGRRFADALRAAGLPD